jgi:hypothetical protein
VEVFFIVCFYVEYILSRSKTWSRLRNDTGSFNNKHGHSEKGHCFLSEVGGTALKFHADASGLSLRPLHGVSRRRSSTEPSTWSSPS